MKRRLYLTFDQAALDTPILSTIVSRFGVVFNIFGATVNDDVQFVAVELEGSEAQLTEVCDFLQEAGVEVETRGDS